jgi:DNA-binding MarR family transcriptional regulator
MMKKDDFDLRHFMPYLLNQAAEASSLDFQQIYKGRYGLLRTEWRVLFHLGIYHRIMAKDICERAKIHKTKVSRALQKLADRRYVTRQTDAADRRHEWLELTPQGRAVYEDLLNYAGQYDEKITSILTPDETRVLRSALIKLAKI